MQSGDRLTHTHKHAHTHTTNVIIFDKDVNKVSQNESVNEAEKGKIKNNTLHHFQGIPKIYSGMIMLRIYMI